MDEYPHWVYSPDGLTGKLIGTPDERPDGWVDTPSEHYAAQGERVIGDGQKQAPQPHTVEVVSPPPVPAEAEAKAEKTSKKAK